MLTGRVSVPRAMATIDTREQAIYVYFAVSLFAVDECAVLQIWGGRRCEVHQTSRQGRVGESATAQVRLSPGQATQIETLYSSEGFANEGDIRYSVSAASLVFDSEKAVRCSHLVQKLYCDGVGADLYG